MLISHGADLAQSDAHGRSPLYMSCLMNHPECTELLLEAGADLEQAMKSITPGFEVMPVLRNVDLGQTN